MQTSTAPAINRELQAWSSSLLLHGVVALFSFTKLLSPTMPLTPEPFRWEVALVDATPFTPSSPAPEQTVASPAGSIPEVIPPPIVPGFLKAPEATQQPIKPEQPTTSRPPAEQPTGSSLSSRPALDSMPQDQPLSEQRVPETIVAAETSNAQPADLAPAPQAALQTQERELPYPPIEPRPGATAQSTADIRSASQEPIAPSPVTAPSFSDQAGSSLQAETAQMTAPAPLPAAAATIPQARAARADYSWLQRSLSKRLEELKRLHRPLLHQEKKVKILVRAVVTDQGLLADATVEQGSGEARLDEAALTLVREAFPMSLEQQLDRPQIAMKIPIVYQRER